MIKKTKTLDKAPIVEYNGRNIFIRSNGAFQNTQIYVEGKEIKNCIALKINLKQGYINTVVMEFADMSKELADAIIRQKLRKEHNNQVA